LKPRTPGTPLRVVLWGTGDTGKPRVRLLDAGLRAQQVEVIDCRTAVWDGIADKSQIRGPWRWAGRLLRLVLAYPRLVWRYLRLPAHDWVLLGYPAIPDIFVIRPFARLRGARVAMDWFLSAYDTVVLDRKLVAPTHPLARLLRRVEGWAIRLPDRLLMDTRAHARRMETLFGLDAGHCDHVWVGAEARFFVSAPTRPRAPGSPLRVLFYGQFIPLHGVQTIIEAARQLRDEPIEWLLIGRGQDAARIRAMLDDVPLPRLQWLDWIDYEQLPATIHDADVCLGIFGMSDKAASVIPNKAFQALAAGRPVVSLDSPAMRELLGAPQDVARLVPAGDATALANVLRDLQRASILPPTPLAAFDAHAVGAQLLACLNAVDRVTGDAAQASRSGRGA